MTTQSTPPPHSANNVLPCKSYLSGSCSIGEGVPVVLVNKTLHPRVEVVFGRLCPPVLNVAKLVGTSACKINILVPRKVTACAHLLLATGPVSMVVLFCIIYKLHAPRGWDTFPLLPHPRGCGTSFYPNKKNLWGWDYLCTTLVPWHEHKHGVKMYQQLTST